MEVVLECLQPDESLKDLRIEDFPGFVLPSWMCGSLLPNVVKLSLFKCKNCIQMPALGSLGSLEVLEVVGLEAVRHIGSEFYGVGIEISFPKLRELTLDNLPEWEETCVMSAATNSSIIMPNLQRLYIWWCGKLKAVPHYMFSPSLKTLYLWDCPHLADGMQPKLPHLQLGELTLRGDVGMFSKSLSSVLITDNNSSYSNLKDVMIGYSPHSSLPQGLNRFTSLQSLSIFECEFLDLKAEEELRHFPMLQQLEIAFSPVVAERCRKEDWGTRFPFRIRIL